MVAGTSGATPGSGAGVEDPKLGRLMPPPQAPKVTVSAEMIARLAIVRVVPKLAMAFPRIISLAAPVTQPTVKPLSEQQLRGRPRPGFAGQHPITASKRA